VVSRPKKIHNMELFEGEPKGERRGNRKGDGVVNIYIIV
jgi:hypothetical protein